MNQYNPGKIIKTNKHWQWQTKLGPYTLNLDIVPLPENKSGQQIGIASFVVMEQDQNFLNYAGKLIAESIIKESKDKKIILTTAESKGSHFIPWVWKNINHNYPHKIHSRVITLRKGPAKIYMQNPTSVNYQSITSSSTQRLTLPPKDERLLRELNFNSYELIFVDDFIGKGGTITAVHKLFKKLNFPPSQLTAVIGSDSNLYQQTFTNKKMEIKLIPDPLPLKLPTFIKSNVGEWRINE